MDVDTCTDTRESTCMLEVGRAHFVFLLGSQIELEWCQMKRSQFYPAFYYAVKMPPRKFALTRWIIDETVLVMPLTAVKKGQAPHVGAFVDMKGSSGLYGRSI